MTSGTLLFSTRAGSSVWSMLPSHAFSRFMNTWTLPDSPRAKSLDAASHKGFASAQSMFAVWKSPSAWPAAVIPIASPPFSVANFVVAAFASSRGSGSGDGGWPAVVLQFGAQPESLLLGGIAAPGCGSGDAVMVRTFRLGMSGSPMWVNSGKSSTPCTSTRRPAPRRRLLDTLIASTEPPASG